MAPTLPKTFLTCPCVALSSSCAFPTFSHILALRNAVSCHSILHTAGKTSLKHSLGYVNTMLHINCLLRNILDSNIIVLILINNFKALVNCFFAAFKIQIY